jgi:hypothetical protein
MLATHSVAQDLPFDKPALGIIYNQEKAVDFRIQTNGWSVGYSWGLLRTAQRTPFYYIGLGELRHPKETRSRYDVQSNGLPARASRAYVLGKQNNLYTLRIGFGEKRYLTEKATRKGVAVAALWQAGLTVGLLKPYHLYLRRLSENNVSFVNALEPYSAANAQDFVNPYAVVGAGGFWPGLDKISPVPGAHVRLGLHLDAGAFDAAVRAAEVGIQLEAFPRNMPIMIMADNRFLFGQLYLSLQLGKRY